MARNQGDCVSTILGLGFVAIIIIYLLSSLWFWENIAWFLGAGILAYILSPLIKNKEKDQEIKNIKKPPTALKDDRIDENNTVLQSNIYFNQNNLTIYSKKKNIFDLLRLFKSPKLNIKDISITYRRPYFFGYIIVENKFGETIELKANYRQTPEEVAAD